MTFRFYQLLRNMIQEKLRNNRVKFTRIITEILSTHFSKASLHLRKTIIEGNVQCCIFLSMKFETFEISNLTSIKTSLAKEFIFSFLYNKQSFV